MIPRHDIYDELMGEPDDFDVFFVIGEDDEGTVILRVMTGEDDGTEWVH